jgi:hypothetical protein
LEIETAATGCQLPVVRDDFNWRLETGGWQLN